MTDETLPLDACCENCKYRINLNITGRICVSPKVVDSGFMLRIDDRDVCRDWSPDDSKEGGLL